MFKEIGKEKLVAGGLTLATPVMAVAQSDLIALNAMAKEDTLVLTVVENVLVMYALIVMEPKKHPV